LSRFSVYLIFSLFCGFSYRSLDIFHSVLQHGIEELKLCLLRTRDNKGKHIGLVCARAYDAALLTAIPKETRLQVSLPGLGFSEQFQEQKVLRERTCMSRTWDYRKIRLEFRFVSRFSKKLLRRKSGASQHAVDRFFRGERIHPDTRKKLAEWIETLEKEVPH
jgi:hypothetical protein